MSIYPYFRIKASCQNGHTWTAKENAPPPSKVVKRNLQHELMSHFCPECGLVPQPNSFQWENHE